MHHALRRCSVPVLAAMVVGGCDVRVGDKGASVGVASETVTDEWVRSYALTSGGRLDVASVNGPIELTASTTGQVEIRIVREATAMTKEGARQSIAAVSIAERTSAGHVAVDVTKTSSGPLRRLQVKVRSEVRVPPGVGTTLRIQNGDIRVNGVAGIINAAAMNGAITARETSGPLTASVMNGRMNIELASVSGDIDLTSRNGTVTIGLGADVKASIDASALNGGVTVDPRLKLDGDSTPAPGRGNASDRVVAGFNGGGPRISVQVINGGVRIGPPGAGSARDGAR